MIAVTKIVYILACGFILSMGLSHQTTWAKDGMEASRSVLRIGGQAGQPYGHVKSEYGSFQLRERIQGPPGERIGGQAGRPYDRVKHDYESDLHARARIGGQAGESYSPILLE